MGISRTTFYATPGVQASDAVVVAEIKAICATATGVLTPNSAR